MQLIFTPILAGCRTSTDDGPCSSSASSDRDRFPILGAATTLWMLFVGRILDASPAATSRRLRLTWPTSPRRRTARGHGHLRRGLRLGFIFGPAIGGVLSRWGISVPFYFAAALAFTNASALLQPPETVTRDHPARAFAARGWSYVWQQLSHRRLALVLLIYFRSSSLLDHDDHLRALHGYRFGYDALHNG